MNNNLDNILMTWRPIETSPLETDVLLYCPNLPEGDTYCWDGDIARPAAMNNKIVVGIWRGREEAGNWVCDIVRIDEGYYGGFNANAIGIEPTHWMPLPEPPKLP